MSFKTQHAVPYFIPLGSPPPLEGLGEVPLYVRRHSLGVCPICFLKNLEN